MSTPCLLEMPRHIWYRVWGNGDNCIQPQLTPIPPDPTTTTARTTWSRRPSLTHAGTPFIFLPFSNSRFRLHTLFDRPYINGKRHWLHTAGTPSLTYYFAHPHRGRKATDAMDVLPHFQGTAVHDAWSAYNHYTQCKHGLCNAHHLRELTAVEENHAQHWATLFKRFLRSAKQVVHDAQVAGQSTLSQPKLDQVERIFALLIEKGLQANPVPEGGWPKGSRGRVKKTKTRNLVERLDQRKIQVLAFVYDFRIPFDNNLAERDIRMLKVQQKISGCFRSPSAAQDFCLIRSYISSIRKQGFNVWSALRSLFSADILLPDFIPV